MGYFMETMDRKGQSQQLELQNRQLRIEFKKAHQAYLELQYRDRLREDDDEGDDELKEREVYAEVIRSYLISILFHLEATSERSNLS